MQRNIQLVSRVTVILDKIEKQAAKEEAMRNERLEIAAKERQAKLDKFKAKMGK